MCVGVHLAGGTGWRTDCDGQVARDDGGQRRGWWRKGHRWGGRDGHADGTQMTCAAADIREQFGLKFHILDRPLEKIISTFAAKTLGLERQ